MNVVSFPDEATARMLENQKNTSTTRVSGSEAESAASVLGISALIINDFKQKRTRDYKFAWDQALNPRYVQIYGGMIFWTLYIVQSIPHIN